MNLSLLIVDDSVIVRSRIARLCGDARLPPLSVVGLAQDGVEAVVLARDKKPDLVTMDLTMPRMEGPACIEAISAMLPQTRILVVSALGDKATALKALKKGAHGYLYKPFSDKDFINAFIELIK